MKRVVVAVVALVVVAAGAIGAQRSFSDDGRNEKPKTGATRGPEFDRAQLEREAKEQAAQQQKALDELADQTKKHADDLKDSEPDQ